MPQEYTLQQALRQAIQAKKDLRDFYLEVAEITEDPAGKKVLQRLCDEVGVNIGKFFKYYEKSDLGSLDEFLATLPDSKSVLLVELRRALDKNVHSRMARELAMREEKSMEESFRHAAKKMIDPLARNVFMEVADDAARHFAVIESEYEYQVTRVHESDVATYVRE
ncbi:MAG: ferritin [Deltaproteobacteria bacterium]|nr:MAG: ferritin [Deltaproteobacteria bacterium]